MGHSFVVPRSSPLKQGAEEQILQDPRLAQRLTHLGERKFLRHHRGRMTDSFYPSSARNGTGVAIQNHASELQNLP